MNKPFQNRKKNYTPTGVMHACRQCRDVKDTSEFPPDNSYKQGFSNRCRQCSRDLMRERRESGWVDPTKNSTNDKKREIIRAAKDVPCADCQESFPYFVMDLDHLPEYEKSFQLGSYLQHSLSAIEAELAKCEPVCANCHRWRTARRSGMV